MKYKIHRLAQWLRSLLQDELTGSGYDHYVHLTRSRQAEKTAKHFQDAAGRCDSFRELSLLQNVMSYNLDDFTTPELIETLKIIEGRMEFLNTIMDIFPAAYYPADFLIESFADADFSLLHCLRVYCRQNAQKYTKADLEAFDRAYHLQLERLPLQTA